MMPWHLSDEYNFHRHTLLSIHAVSCLLWRDPSLWCWLLLTVWSLLLFSLLLRKMSTCRSSKWHGSCTTSTFSRTWCFPNPSCTTVYLPWSHSSGECSLVCSSNRLGPPTLGFFVASPPAIAVYSGCQYIQSCRTDLIFAISQKRLKTLALVLSKMEVKGQSYHGYKSPLKFFKVCELKNNNFKALGNFWK